MNQELETGNTESANLNQQIETLVNEKAILNEELGSLNEELGNLNEELNSLNGELAKGNTEISTLKEKLETAQHKIVNDEFAKYEEISVLEKKLKGEIADRDNKLKVEGTTIIGLKKEIIILKREVDKRMADYRKVNQERYDKDLQNKHLNKELAKGESEVNQLKQKIEKLNSDKSGLKKELDEAKSEKLDSEKSSLKQELDEAKSEITKLKQKLDEAKSENLNSDKSGLTQELDKAKSEITDLKQKVESLADNNRHLDWMVEELSASEAGLDSANKGLEQERNKLQHDLENEKDQQRAKDNEIETQYARIQEQTQTLEARNVDLARLLEGLANKDKDIDHANEANAKLEEQNEALEQRLRTVNGQVKGAEKQMWTLRTELNTLKPQHERMTKELQEKVDTLSMRVANQPKDKRNELKKEFAATLEAKKALELEVDMFRTQVAGLQQDMSNLNKKHKKAAKKLRKIHGYVDTDDEEAAGGKAGAAAETAATAGETAEAVGEQAATAGETAQITEKKADAVHKKADAVHKKADAAEEKAETSEEQIKTPHESPVEKQEAAGDVPTVDHLAVAQNHEPAVIVIEEPKLPSAEVEAKAETSQEKLKTPHENKVEKQEAAGDVPTADHLAVAQNHEPAVTVLEEPKLPSTEVEAKRQGPKPKFNLMDVEFFSFTGLHQGTGNSSGTEAETVINANALAKAEKPHKRIPQAEDPFTEARVPLKAPFDPDYDVSDSGSVGSTTELSTDNQTPRALRRPLGQEGVDSRRHSTATQLSVTNVEKWINRTSSYVDQNTQTDDGVLVKDVPTENGPVETPMVLVEDLWVPTENGPVEKPMVLMRDMGVQTEVETPKFRQTRRYLMMTSFVHLLLLLLYLGIFYFAWSSWTATRAERDLWTRTNSALTHRRLLVENGSYPPSAISEIFYRKM